MCAQRRKQPFFMCFFFIVLLQAMVEMTLTTCVQDQALHQVPLEIVSDILSQVKRDAPVGAATVPSTMPALELGNYGQNMKSQVTPVKLWSGSRGPDANPN